MSNKIHMTWDAAKGRGSLSINDHDISHEVGRAGVKVEFQDDGPPLVTVTFLAHELDFYGSGDVTLTPEQALALVVMGWTAPEGQAVSE